MLKSVDMLAPIRMYENYTWILAANVAMDGYSKLVTK
jgi:hypothetical protein